MRTLHLIHQDQEMKPQTIIDADGHICEPELVWTHYTAKKYRDSVLQIHTENGRSAIAIEGHSRLAGDGPGPAEACIPVGMAPGPSLTWDDLLPGGRAPHAWPPVLDGV